MLPVKKICSTPYSNRCPRWIPAGEQARLRVQALRLIVDQVVPAYRQLLAFMREEYLPKAHAVLAAESLPEGGAYYRAKIFEYTTLDLDPEAIYQIGVAEVAKLCQQIDQAIVDSGFKTSSDQQIFPAFLYYLRTDPKFYPKTPEALLKEAAWIAKRVDAKIGHYIGRLPRRRFAIEPVPADVAPYYTRGRGGPGIYFVNTYDLPSRPLCNLPALTLHESSPGHAL